MALPKTALLTGLRREIRRLERGDGPPDNEPPLRVTGFAALDGGLPRGGLERAALHEITGGEGAGRASAAGFALHLAARFAGGGKTVLWCLRASDLYGPGIESAGFGNAVGRLIVARGNNADEVLWAMEEGLASGAPAAVLGEPGRLAARVARQAHRRLQLAAENHGVPALLLCDAGFAAASSAFSRWRIAPAPGGRWRIELLKCRGGRPGAWSVPAPGLPEYFHERHVSSSSLPTAHRRSVVSPSGEGTDSRAA